MSLDLRLVVDQVAAMSGSLADTAETREERLVRALGAFDEHWADRDKLQGKLGAAKTSWLLAQPHEPPGRYPVPEPKATTWRVLATDGSQIEVSRHEVAGCYLVNVGEVLLDYGVGAQAHISSRPDLYFADDDLHPLYGGEDRPADGAIVGAVRDTAELTRLKELVEEADRPGIALVDGTLILWRDETNPRGLKKLDPDDLKRKRLDAMLGLFDAGRQQRIPVVGYVSSPGGSDVVNALKVMICPEHPVDCDKCPYTPPDTRRTAFKHKPCDVVDRVTDAKIFGRHLTPGERSPLFWSGAPVLDAYDEHQIAFCYLNTGYEIARLEVPAWVANDTKAMQTAHALAFDQATRGRGYPVALAEAHEAAVVRGSDRAGFFTVLQRKLAKDGHRIELSRKELRKRRALA